MEVFENVLTQISDLLWGYPLIILLFGTHLLLTFRLRFIQRFIGKAIKISLRRDKEGSGDISQFGALTIALAAYNRNGKYRRFQLRLLPEVPVLFCGCG